MGKGLIYQGIRCVDYTSDLLEVFHKHELPENVNCFLIVDRLEKAIYIVKSEVRYIINQTAGYVSIVCYKKGDPFVLWTDHLNFGQMFIEFDRENHIETFLELESHL